jgi:large subunit ribosomal protein L6
MFVAVPSYVKIICLKSSVFLLKSCNKVKLSQYITLLCKSRIPDVYKGKGILYSDKKVFLKQGKHN